MGGKNVIATGASSGLGALFARIPATDRAHVILTARRRDKLLEIEEKIGGGWANSLTSTRRCGCCAWTARPS